MDKLTSNINSDKVSQVILDEMARKVGWKSPEEKLLAEAHEKARQWEAQKKRSAFSKRKFYLLKLKGLL